MEASKPTFMSSAQGWISFWSICIVSTPTRFMPDSVIAMFSLPREPQVKTRMRQAYKPSKTVILSDFSALWTTEFENFIFRRCATFFRELLIHKNNLGWDNFIPNLLRSELQLLGQGYTNQKSAEFSILVALENTLDFTSGSCATLF